MNANYLKIKRLVDDADSVLIGAGAGLSTAAGFIYSGKRFKDNFADLEQKYGFRDMYSGGFYPYESLEEKWAFWSRYVFLNRYSNIPKRTYDNLFDLIKNKNYFVLTTNVDHCFQKSGFDKKRLFYTQGDFGLFQCSAPCHNETYDNESIIRRMVEEQRNMRIPSSLIPYCPNCGKPMEMNLRADDSFVQDDGWYAACERYENFLEKNKNRKILLLELGVGMNTPAIIKYPFWRLTLRNEKAIYVCINYGDAVCPPQIEKQSICINADIDSVLNKSS